MEIWRYQIPPEHDPNILSIPQNGQVLTVQVQVQVQAQCPTLWVLVNPAAKEETRIFKTFGTGHEIEIDRIRNYIGSYQLWNGSFVGHVFEEL